MSTATRRPLPSMPVARPLPVATPVPEAPPIIVRPTVRRARVESDAFRVDKNTFLFMMVAAAVILLALIFGLLLKSYSENKAYQEPDWRQQLDPGNSEVLMKLDDEDTKKKMEDEIRKGFQRVADLDGDPDLGSR